MASSSTKRQRIITEEMDLFSLPPVNVTEKKKMWVDHLPTFGGNVRNGKGCGGGSIQFTIPGTGTQYTSLRDTNLYVRLSVRKPDGTPFTQSIESCAIPIDNVLHSLWSMVDVKLNGVLVSTSNTNYMYKAFIQTLLNHRQGTRDNQLSLRGFSGDSGNFDQRDKDGFPYGTGIQTRYEWFQKIDTIYDQATSGKEGNDADEEWTDPRCVEFIGPLLADICDQDRLIPNGVDIDIKLFENKDDFRLTTFPDNTKAEIVLEEVKLQVCKVTVTDAAIVGVESKMTHQPCRYPMLRTDLRTFNISQGLYSEIAEDMFQGEVPTRLVIGMVDAEAYAGSTKLNPYRFKPFNVASIGFFVDGEATPHAPMELDIKEGCYVEGLESLYRVTGKWNMDEDIPITRATYRQGYTLFGLQVDGTTSPNLDYVGHNKSGRTRLVIKFHKPLARPITVIVYATFPETMEIDQYRLISMTEKDKSSARLKNLPVV
jgi:hypothetical protein